MNVKKLRNGKVKLEIDNKKIVTYEDVVLKNNILYKNKLSEEDISDIEKGNLYYNIYNKVIKLISVKYRSEYEIVKYLNKHEIDKEYQDKIISELKDNNLINDLRFCDLYILDKINLTNVGPYKIKKELIDNKIDELLITNKLKEYNSKIWEEKIRKHIDKKLKTTKYSNYVLKNKLVLYLVNLGFEKDMIINIINEYDLTNNNIEKEYNKVYLRFKNKLNKEELNKKIITRLMSKGYSYSEIEKCIKKEED